MNEDYYRKANLLNCNAIYKSKLQFMTLKEIKALHDNKALCSKDLKLDQDTMLKTLEILEAAI